MSPRRDVSEERKEQILDAAAEVFSRKGFDKARMDDIVEKTGLSKGALYWYFKSKDEIFEALVVDKHPYKKVLPLIMKAEGETMDEFLGNESADSSKHGITPASSGSAARRMRQRPDPLPAVPARSPTEY